MPVINTLKHEMSYDTTSKRAIFNARNKTGSMPKQDAFPKRLLSLAEGSESYIDGHTLVLGLQDDVDAPTIDMKTCSIEEHTLDL